MAIAGGAVGEGAWLDAVERAEAGWLLLPASWARVEPERGRYDDAELAACRRAVLDARKKGLEPVVVAHAGALPDWAIGRGGWLAPDALATWGCYVDRLGGALGELLRWWVGLATPLEEAAWYEDDARRVARILIDAQAAAYLHLRRGPGAGGAPAGVGVLARWGADHGLRGAIADRTGPEALVRVLATGRLGPPFAAFGELPNGTPAVDWIGVDWAGRGEGLARVLARLGAWGLPLVVRGGSVADVVEAEETGVRVLARLA